MSVIFADSFDHYTSITSPNGKYDNAGSGCSISTVPGQSRTGPGCLAIATGAYGAGKFVKRNTDMLVACAWYATEQGECLWIRDSLFQSGSEILRLEVNVDGSVQVSGWTNGPVLGTSAPGLVAFGAYNSIAFRATFQGGVSWLARVYVNGHLVLTVPTTVGSVTASTAVDGFYLMGPGGGAGTCFVDDVYVLDCTDAVHNTYLGALRCYASVPVANGSPLQWTPLTGTNWSQVNEIPPDGDTSYNSDGTVSDADQYLHPLSIPTNAQIYAVQHCMDLEVDSGARSVTSDIAGVLNPTGIALAAGYVIRTWDYDQNPATAAPWQATDFPLLAGPAVSA
jgi:hypothetical protein